MATQNPVIVYADSQNWGNANIRHNILTVWAVSNTHVRVTKVSNLPSGDFNYNQIISLTWEEFFQKAITISNNSVANVAFVQ